MKVNTKLFGEIEIDEDKILTFDAGIVGFPDLTRFALMHDESDTEDGGNGLSFLVSLDEPAFAMPVINPLIVKDDYNPTVAERGRHAGAGDCDCPSRYQQDDSEPHGTFHYKCSYLQGSTGDIGRG